MSEDHPPLSATVRSLLSSRGITAAEMSRLSRLAFPADKRFHVPPNLYHLLDEKQFTPSVYQIFALSRFSCYRLADWLVVFGLPLDEIPRLQMVLPARLTTLIDESLSDEREPVLRFVNKIAEASSAICLDNSLLKSVAGADIANPHRQTVPAYAVDED